MMRIVLLKPGLYGTHNHLPGDVLDVDDDLGRDIIDRGDGRRADGSEVRTTVNQAAESASKTAARRRGRPPKPKPTPADVSAPPVDESSVEVESEAEAEAEDEREVETEAEDD